MRCREFIMKDMYSYSTNEAEHMDFYNTATQAYLNIYKAVGLGDITFVTSARNDREAHALLKEFGIPFKTK